MKLLTKEEEEAHYNATLKGGAIGGLSGLAAGLAGVSLATRRYPAFASLTLPFRAFLVTSAGTFSGIVAADHASRRFEELRNQSTVTYQEERRARRESELADMSTMDKIMEFGRKERYKIVFGSWVASIAGSWAIVNRDRYMTAAQKIVQARVYAQGFTLLVLIATAAFEISDSKSETGRYETVKVLDENDPEHKRMIEKRIHKERYEGEDLWMDMVKAEEERLKERDHAVKEKEERDAKKKKEAEKKKAAEKKESEKKEKEEKDEKKEDKKE